MNKEVKDHFNILKRFIRKWVNEKRSKDEEDPFMILDSEEYKSCQEVFKIVHPPSLGRTVGKCIYYPISTLTSMILSAKSATAMRDIVTRREYNLIEIWRLHKTLLKLSTTNDNSTNDNSANDISTYDDFMEIAQKKGLEFNNIIIKGGIIGTTIGGLFGLVLWALFYQFHPDMGNFFIRNGCLELFQIPGVMLSTLQKSCMWTRTELIIFNWVVWVAIGCLIGCFLGCLFAYLTIK